MNFDLIDDRELKFDHVTHLRLEAIISRLLRFPSQLFLEPL